MQLETVRQERKPIRMLLEKRRVHSDVGRLTREAQRRRRRANALVAGSLVAVAVLVRVLYGFLAS